jgi:hypothetical protein
LRGGDNVDCPRFTRVQFSGIKAATTLSTKSSRSESRKPKKNREVSVCAKNEVLQRFTLEAPFAGKAEKQCEKRSTEKHRRHRRIFGSAYFFMIRLPAASGTSNHQFLSSEK